jgi:hypothetical protein
MRPNCRLTAISMHVRMQRAGWRTLRGLCPDVTNFYRTVRSIPASSSAEERKGKAQSEITTTKPASRVDGFAAC